MTHITRRGLLAGAAASLAGCIPTPQTALRRGVAWLWSQQASDGGWHSRTYGLLRSGQALTPFVLDALLDAVHAPPREPTERAIAFIRTRTHSSGALGLSDPNIPDYPNYATALAVSAIVKAGLTGWQDQIAPMVAYLRTQQFTEQNGWRPPNAPYGAWGMGGARRAPPNTGHVDLSMTRYVLEALRASGAADADPAFSAARIYVERCQNFDPAANGQLDGGFFFTTTEEDTNKAGRDYDRFRSYGTATADGIIALRLTGPPGTDADTDPRIQAARDWLIARHRGLDVPGFIGGPAYRRWPKGMAYYYAAASTRAFRLSLLDEVVSIRPGSGPPDRIVPEALAKTQRADGSWANPETLVKEDDPLIATPFAVQALA